MAQNSKTVHVVKTDKSGHFAGDMAVEEFAGYNWDARREVVTVDNVQVDSLEAFMQAVYESTLNTPEVFFFPPLAGGI